MEQRCCESTNFDLKQIDNMTDKLTKEQRHLCMSHIRGKDTKPEMIVRKFLFANGFRYRLHVKGLPGKPDIVLRKYRTVLFVNGCFWHGHEGCSYAKLPDQNREFWASKISLNKERDMRECTLLSASGWNIIVIWQCQLKSKIINETLNRLLDELKGYKQLEKNNMIAENDINYK
jgi:DNA mismatch endonuclease (patch repair protein)